MQNVVCLMQTNGNDMCPPAPASIVLRALTLSSSVTG